MYVFSPARKKDCVLIQDAFRLNGLTKLHEKQDGGKNALKERKNAKHSHSATDAPQNARKGATGIILYMARTGAEKRFYEPHREEKII